MSKRTVHPPLGMFDSRTLPALFHFNAMLWALGKQRKVRACWICAMPIEVGEKSYRPITNNGERYRRICARCGTRLAPKEKP